MIGWSVETVEHPTERPVTLEQAKEHLRVDHNDEDGLITVLIDAATQDAEAFMGRSLTTRTLRLHMDRFPRSGVLMLPYPPVQRVEDIQYRDAGGRLVPLPPEGYMIDYTRAPARISPMPGVTWPVVESGLVGAVRVDYVAGYSDEELPPPTYAWQPGGFVIGGQVPPKPVPANVKQAILLTVGHLYENREAVHTDRGTPVELPFGVKHLLMKDRVFMPEVK